VVPESQGAPPTGMLAFHIDLLISCARTDNEAVRRAHQVA
jgi:hypothetical protein